MHLSWAFVFSEPPFQKVGIQVISAEKPTVVVADADPDLLEHLEDQFTQWGYRVHTAQNRHGLFEWVWDWNPSIIVIDLRFGDADGIDVYRDLLANGVSSSVLFLTADGSNDTAVKANKMGASDFPTKPPELPRLKRMLQQAAESHSRLSVATARDLPVGIGESRLLGASAAMRKVHATIRQVAATDASVMVVGESGTGKELVALEVHDWSGRSQHDFVPVNVAALPEGLVESVFFGHTKGAFTGADKTQAGLCHQAHKGTLFLDEIGEMPLALQPKLLRFLQEQTLNRVGSSQSEVVDVRIVSATNRDPQRMIEEGRLREDLYYRLNVVPILIPALRERREDIEVLANAFLRQAAERAGKQVDGFTRAALDRLVEYDWPGNVRELENLVERLVIFSHGNVISEHQLPADLTQTDSGPAVRSSLLNADGRLDATRNGERSLTAMKRAEKLLIINALADTDGNVVQAARILGLGQATVYRKIKSYSIQRRRYDNRHT